MNLQMVAKPIATSTSLVPMDHDAYERGQVAGDIARELADGCQDNRDVHALDTDVWRQVASEPAHEPAELCQASRNSTNSMPMDNDDQGQRQVAAGLACELADGRKPITTPTHLIAMNGDK